MNKRPRGPRVFALDELDGFYVGDGICVHVTFEDRHSVAIDLFDDEAAATNPHKGEVIAAVLLDLKTGNIAPE